MAATISTTIPGVSILSKEKKRGADTFELVLSRQGIEVHRPGRPVQRMSWDRVSEWEIEERKGCVLLTLHGHGATTPLVVPGWTLGDLELLMRDVTAGATSPDAEPDDPERAAVALDADDKRSAAAVAVVAEPAPAPAPPVPAHADPIAASDAAPPAAPAPPRPSRAGRRAGRRRLSWRLVVTVVLLGVLATAVILVLLQSAGVIDWSFLGPVA